MADDSVTVKGLPVLSLQKFVKNELTAEQHDRLFAQLPGDYARLRSPILATETIPVHLLNHFTEEAARAKGEPVEQFAKRAGRAAAASAVKGIYRFFAMVLTPEAVLSKGSQMWSSLYNRGKLEVHDETEKGATIRLMDFPSEAAGCARLTGWIERMAEVAGVNDLHVVHPECVARGAPHCEWKVSWR